MAVLVNGILERAKRSTLHRRRSLHVEQVKSRTLRGTSVGKKKRVPGTDIPMIKLLGYILRNLGPTQSRTRVH